MRHPTHRTLTLVALVLIVARLSLGWLLWDPVDSALTWDDFTRVLLAQRWASDPFISADLVWLPLQTWFLGSLFWLTGDTFASNPMALVAITNSLFVVAAASVVGRTALRLSASRTGALLAFAIVLFSPWGYYTSLAGLSEPIYYLAVAVSVCALVDYHLDRSARALWIGACAIALAAATRYEGWWLMVAWAATVLFVTNRFSRSGHGHPRWATTLLAIGTPFLVPLAWMIYNLIEAGSPLEFARLSGEYFANAYGGLPTVVGRIAYYPVSLVRADLLLLILILGTAWRFRREPLVRLVTLVVGLHLGLFYAASVLSGATGAFNERFMFAFLLAAAPVVGLAPRLFASVPTPARTLTAAVVCLSIVGITAYRWTDRPVEWTHAPDLLALLGALDDAAGDSRELAVTIGPEMQAIEALPLTVVSGSTIRLTVGSESDAGTDLLVRRYPAGNWEDPGSAFGRYEMTGPLAGAMSVDPMECPCNRWTLTSEIGTHVDLPSGPFAWTEFAGTDPPAGSEAVVATRLDPGVGEVRIEARSLYGHGFNPGRIVVEVRLDGQVIEAWDIAEPSRWRSVDLTVPAEGGVLEVAVVAQPGIEQGWAWGTASTVLIRKVEDVPG